MERGFFASLFDISFTSYITTKIIKVLYVVTLVVIALVALVFVVAAFQESTAAGVAVLLVGAPLSSLIYAIYTRVLLEFIVQVFRIGELLRDQSAMQRTAFAAAGWLPGDPAAPMTTIAPAPPAPPASTTTTCANCGAEAAPGAKFCRSCGHQLG